MYKDKIKITGLTSSIPGWRECKSFHLVAFYIWDKMHSPGDKMKCRPEMYIVRQMDSTNVFLSVKANSLSCKVAKSFEQYLFNMLRSLDNKWTKSKIYIQSLQTCRIIFQLEGMFLKV